MRPPPAYDFAECPPAPPPALSPPPDAGASGEEPTSDDINDSWVLLETPPREYTLACFQRHLDMDYWAVLLLLLADGSGESVGCR